MRNRLLTWILCPEIVSYPPPGFQRTIKRWWRLQPEPDRLRSALSGLVELMPTQYAGFPKSRQSVMIAQPERDLSGDIHTLGFILVCGRCLKKVLSSDGQRHMAMEIGYGIRKLCPIHARTPDLVSLRQWGSHLKGQWRKTFEGKYDNLLGLLEIKVQPEALSALTQYYDPPLRCFTFRDFYLAPMLEEYERILGMPLARSLPYLFKGKYPS
ncbi:hypothetical protein CR513_18882, partial [Mucuna pruriens]